MPGGKCPALVLEQAAHAIRIDAGQRR